MSLTSLIGDNKFIKFIVIFSPAQDISSSLKGSFFLIGQRIANNELPLVYFLHIHFDNNIFSPSNKPNKLRQYLRDLQMQCYFQIFILKTNFNMQ